MVQAHCDLMDGLASEIERLDALLKIALTRLGEGGEDLAELPEVDLDT